MLAWLESVAGSAYATAILWTLGALLLLVVILLLIKVIRSLSFGTFVSGGRNRKTRLAVMDATAVDSHRRLVLVRRDDVEHLILIGGPTDVVVENNIRLAQTLRRPVQDDAAAPREIRAPAEAQPAETAAPPAAAPQEAQVSKPLRAPDPVPQPRPQPVPMSAPMPAPAAVRPAPAYPRAVATPPPAARPVAPPPASPPAAPQQAAASAPPPPAPPMGDPAPRAAAVVPPRAVNDQPPSLDDALLEELEVTLDRNAGQDADGPGLPSSVEDEMSRLLGDLSRPRR